MALTERIARTEMACRKAYNESMSLTLGSKLFFLPRLPMDEVGLVVDFGCADGALCRVMHAAHPDIQYVGIDADPQQLVAAAYAFPEMKGYASLTAFKDLARPCPPGKKSMLILSSVLHELFSTPVFRWSRGWNLFEEMGFDYVCIRDFALPHDAYLWETPPEWLDTLYGKCVSVDGWAEMLRSFESRYGHIGYVASATHFLLKSLYPENWEREMEENYVAYDRETMLMQFQSGRYTSIHEATTTTPYFRRRMWEEHGLRLLTHTHLELILERRQ